MDHEINRSMVMPLLLDENSSVVFCESITLPETKTEALQGHAIAVSSIVTICSSVVIYKSIR